MRKLKFLTLTLLTIGLLTGCSSNDVEKTIIVKQVTSIATGGTSSVTVVVDDKGDKYTTSTEECSRLFLDAAEGDTFTIAVDKDGDVQSCK